MMQECNRMTNLVSNISTLVNLEANTTKFTYQLVQIPDVLTRLEKRLIPLAQRNHIQLSFEDQTHNLHFETDPQKLEAILFNLLENACLHTLSNVRVQLKVEAFPETVHFTVLDNGQGIPQDKLPTLFQPFIRVEEVMNHSKGGAGLGLAITRELVEKMGGTIVVESTQGQGSQFTVSLPQYP
jgi:signal transduction histidine kinase